MTYRLYAVKVMSTVSHQFIIENGSLIGCSGLFDVMDVSICEFAQPDGDSISPEKF